jgi:hypothetical protein
MSGRDAGFIVAATLGTAWGMIATATDVKASLMIFLCCPPVFVWLQGLKVLRIGGLPSWAIVPSVLIIVVANALLYVSAMKLCFSLAAWLRSRSSQPER